MIIRTTAPSRPAITITDTSTSPSGGLTPPLPCVTSLDSGMPGSVEPPTSLGAGASPDKVPVSHGESGSTIAGLLRVIVGVAVFFLRADADVDADVVTFVVGCGDVDVGGGAVVFLVLLVGVPTTVSVPMETGVWFGSAAWNVPDSVATNCATQVIPVLGTWHEAGWLRIPGALIVTVVPVQPPLLGATVADAWTVSPTRACDVDRCPPVIE